MGNKRAGNTCLSMNAYYIFVILAFCQLGIDCHFVQRLDYFSGPTALTPSTADILVLLELIREFLEMLS